MKKLEKTVEVTITVTEGGMVAFDYYEPESGDMYRVVTDSDTMCEEESRVGTEILSWASLMLDELDELEEETE